jgi:alkylation response protein AidB-like acyl-CoA dehydrogenase
MDFKLSEEQQMLQDTAARLVRDSYPFEKREEFSKSELGFSQAFWNQLGELGLTAVPFAEEFGGFGGTGVETMLVMTELGRGLTLEPYLQSVIFGGGLLNQLGTPLQKEIQLAEVAAGSLQLAVATEEVDSHYNLASVTTSATAKDGGYVLNGRKAVVIGGHSAGQIIVSARTSGGQFDEAGISLFLVDPTAAGVTRRVYPTVDGRKAAELLLDNVQVSADALLGEVGNAFNALRYQQGRAIAAQCALAVGSMEEACNITLDYLKTRKQFGAPIGKFQALQHRMVDMLTEREQATSMAILAACHADAEDSAERTRVLTAAKYIVTRGARFVAEQAIQLHGGIGMTWEYNLAHHAKTLVMIGHEFGDEDFALKAYSKDLQVA